MIQRIQTIFLILYIGALVCTFFFPVWQKISFDQRLKLHGSKKSTLREGHADNWKKLFDDEISERFKAVLPGPL